MSILDLADAAAVRRHFTHRGWFLACPVYVNLSTGEMQERAGIPAAVFWVNFAALQVVQFVRVILGLPELDGFPVLVGAPLPDGAPLWQRSGGEDDGSPD